MPKSTRKVHGGTSPVSRTKPDLTEKENVTEKLKSENQMLWVQKMNNIRNRAVEIVNTELIYIL